MAVTHPHPVPHIGSRPLPIGGGFSLGAGHRVGDGLATGRVGRGIAPALPPHGGMGVLFCVGRGPRGAGHQGWARLATGGWGRMGAGHRMGRSWPPRRGRATWVGIGWPPGRGLATGRMGRWVGKLVGKWVGF